VTSDEGAGVPIGSARTWRLRLVRASNVTLATDPSLADLYRARFEGAPPKVRARGGVLAFEYGPRLNPADWGRQAAEITLNPSVGWRIETARGVRRLSGDLRALRLLGVELGQAAKEVELTLPRPDGPVLVRFAGGASELTLHLPAGTASRVQVTGGASRVTFDDQSYRAVAGEASWKTSGYEQAADRYDIEFAQGVRDVVVDTVELEAAAPRRLLATVLFTDIVGSTERARRLGDERWRVLLARHDEAARRLVEGEGGRLLKRTGDGILARFDTPGRAIRAALALQDELRSDGVELRAGVHTGEVDLLPDDVGGIAVHIAARVMAAAGPGEVLVSPTVRDLAAGSGIAFQDRGDHTLKGIADPWRLFAATAEGGPG
jgi:class 3 adenylate cyclase